MKNKEGGSKPVSGKVATTSLRSAQSLELQETEVEKEETEEAEEVKAASVVCYLPAGNEAGDVTLLRQACVTGLATDTTPKWLRSRLDDWCPRERVGKPLVPLRNPATTGQLILQVELEGKPAQMLYDPGATHCFLDLQWSRKNGLKVQDRPAIPLQLFVGTSRRAVQWTYTTSNLALGESQYSCTFLVLDGAPSDIVLGFNFLNKHQPEIDYSTMLFWNTIPTPQVPLPLPSRLEGETPEDQSETLVLAACDIHQTAQLRNVQVLQVGKWNPFWGNNQLLLYSVTAGTEEEEVQLPRILCYAGSGAPGSGQKT